MESSHELEKQAARPLFGDTATDIAFSAIIRSAFLSSADDQRVEDNDTTLLWVLRIVAVFATVAMAAVTVAAFQINLALGALALFSLPVVVLGFVLVIEGVCKYVFRLS